jgi:PHD-finger
LLSNDAGHEVDWVQCDACQKWFHLVCVGLTKMDVSDDKDYICRTCRGHVSPQAGVGGLSSQGYDAGGRFVPRANDLILAGRGDTSNHFDLGLRTQHGETVVQSIGYDYVAPNDGSYESQLVEYDTGNEVQVSQEIGMECHETLDSDQLSADHVVIAIGEEQDANQVIYMYADGGPEIVTMDDLVEVETAEVVDQIEEDCETTQDVDGVQAIELSSAEQHSGADQFQPDS